jgi:hypothetical protein
MHVTFTRGRQTHEDAPLRPTVGVRIVGARTDMTCAACGHVIAHGVLPDRVQEDAGFFLEAHKPFCLGMRAAG